MKRKKGFLSSSQGFSLVSTLVAVAIGGIVASLIATVISDAVRGQRSIIDRDEMSEFALFVKSLVTTDSTCAATLKDISFTPGGSNEISLPVDYAGQPGPIGAGFKFAAGALSVQHLTLEDKGLPPVGFSIPTAAGPVTVQRYVARLKLQLAHINGTGYRARYFEFPVLVDGAHKIRMCNNELNIADACQALGFVWDTSTTPATCKPSGACQTAGTYTTGPGSLFAPGACTVANPVTTDCSCPTGYTGVASGTVNIKQSCHKGCDGFTYNTVYQCFRCN